MHLVMTGASGFIGSALSDALLRDGHTLRLLTHSVPPNASTANKRWLHWTPGLPGEWEKAIEACDGVINLAGEPIAARRWTHHQKRKILSSRMDVTSSLVDAMSKASRPPRLFIHGSAIGFYGDCGSEIVTEERTAGSDFLARVCDRLEAEAARAESFGCRVVNLRSGIVLGQNGGALSALAKPFKLFVGGPLGSGKQWVTWIHIEDEVGLIRLAIENDRVRGPINATAPHPVTNYELSRALGRALRRPSWTQTPAFALRLILGEMADMLLSGQRVIPAFAQRLGYQFRFPMLSEALADCCGRSGFPIVDERAER